MRRLHSGVSWLEMFRGANRRRTLVGIGILCLQQAQGVAFVANYTTVTFISLGIKNVYDMVLVLYAVLLVSSFGAYYFPDKFGRRTLLLVGSASCATWMGIIGLLQRLSRALKALGAIR
ncbi:hypothetical protein NW759_015002 [Fusarium solani]|nr:hypothetical protein NW759_015002 [Fusarium solani]